MQILHANTGRGWEVGTVDGPVAAVAPSSAGAEFADFVGCGGGILDSLCFAFSWSTEGFFAAATLLLLVTVIRRGAILDGLVVVTLAAVPTVDFLVFNVEGEFTRPVRVAAMPIVSLDDLNVGGTTDIRTDFLGAIIEGRVGFEVTSEMRISGIR